MSNFIMTFVRYCKVLCLFIAHKKEKKAIDLIKSELELSNVHGVSGLLITENTVLSSLC